MAKGNFIKYIVSDDPNKYPTDGEQSGYYYELVLTPPPKPYLSFIGNEEFTLKTYNTTANWDGTLEYSTDTTTWNTWDGTEISSSGNNLYLRGTGNTVITGSSSNYRLVFTGTDSLKVACKGNIENLLDYQTVESEKHPSMADYCYACMFQACTSLTTAPELPATTLSKNCYQQMFYGCTNLITAPELPATTLTEKCYRTMFANCTSLTRAPSLPATTLDMYCYSYMFNNCTSLATLPALPATTTRDNCYSYMFQNCTKIKLSATQTGEYQTEYRIPTTGTGTLAAFALSNMFASTGGTFTGTPQIDTTYYTSNTVV